MILREIQKVHKVQITSMHLLELNADSDDNLKKLKDPSKTDQS